VTQLRSVELNVGRQYETDLGSTSAGRNDVGGSGASTTPVLGGGAVDRLLGSGVGVDSSHETLDDAKLVVQDLGKRSQAVGGARSIGKNVHVLGVLPEVDTAHEHGGIGRRSGAVLN